MEELSGRRETVNQMGGVTLNRERPFAPVGVARRGLLALAVAVAALPAVVAPAGATHSPNTLGNISSGGTTPPQYDGKGEQVNVQGVSGGGGNGSTHEGCIQMTQLRFAVVYVGGYARTGPAGFVANKNTFSNGSTLYTANPANPIEGIITVEDNGLYEGPRGTYDASSFVPGAGCQIAGAGATVPVNKISAVFRQGGNSICAPGALGATESTTGSIQRGSPSGAGRELFVLSNVKCGTHFYTMKVLITQATPNSVVGVCVAPVAPTTCNVLASQLEGI